MKTKYIKGSKKQYSIREDGFVIKNYKRQRITNTRIDIIVVNKIVKFVDVSSVQMTINGKGIRRSIYRLMHEYFGFAYCRWCNNRFKQNISPVSCDKCRNESRKESLKKDFVKKKERRLETSRFNVRKKTKELHDSYICASLRVPVGTLPTELIELKREQLKLHRELKKQEKYDTNK